MALLVARGFLLQILAQSLCEIDACLIGQTEKNPKHISHLVGWILGFTCLERLVTIFSSHNASKFAYLLSENSHIGQFGEIAHSIGMNPLVHKALSLIKRDFPCRYLCGISIHDLILHFHSHDNILFWSVA